MCFDSKWVAVARHGIILWENGAADLRILLKYLPDLKNTFFFSDILLKLPINRPSGRYFILNPFPNRVSFYKISLESKFNMVGQLIPMPCLGHPLTLTIPTPYNHAIHDHLYLDNYLDKPGIKIPPGTMLSMIFSR